MKKAKKMLLEEEAISNIKQDRMIINKFLLSIAQQLNGKDGLEATSFHHELGEVFAKYILASVKNNEQLVEMVKLIAKKEEIALEDEKITDKEIQDLYQKIGEKE
jgi:NCAIR mutase (PurE)-related protein